MNDDENNVVSLEKKRSQKFFEKGGRKVGMGSFDMSSGMFNDMGMFDLAPGEQFDPLKMIQEMHKKQRTKEQEVVNALPFDEVIVSRYVNHYTKWLANCIPTKEDNVIDFVSDDDKVIELHRNIWLVCGVTASQFFKQRNPSKEEIMDWLSTVMYLDFQADALMYEHDDMRSSFQSMVKWFLMCGDEELNKLYVEKSDNSKSNTMKEKCEGCDFFDSVEMIASKILSDDKLSVTSFAITLAINQITMPDFIDHLEKKYG